MVVSLAGPGTCTGAGTGAEGVDGKLIISNEVGRTNIPLKHTRENM